MVINLNRISHKFGTNGVVMSSLCIQLMKRFILTLQLPVNDRITALAMEIVPSSISASVRTDFMELTARLVNIDVVFHY